MFAKVQLFFLISKRFEKNLIIIKLTDYQRKKLHFFKNRSICDFLGQNFLLFDFQFYFVCCIFILSIHYFVINLSSFDVGMA